MVAFVFTSSPHPSDDYKSQRPMESAIDVYPRPRGLAIPHRDNSPIRVVVDYASLPLEEQKRRIRRLAKLLLEPISVEEVGNGCSDTDSNGTDREVPASEESLIPPDGPQRGDQSP